MNGRIKMSNNAGPVEVDINKALIVKTKKGEARRIKTNVQLSVKDGTLCNTFGAMGIIVSADGYLRVGARS